MLGVEYFILVRSLFQPHLSDQHLGPMILSHHKLNLNLKVSLNLKPWRAGSQLHNVAATPVPVPWSEEI